MINVPFSSSGSKSDSPSESLHSHWTSNFSFVVTETFRVFMGQILNRQSAKVGGSKEESWWSDSKKVYGYLEQNQVKVNGLL